MLSGFALAWVLIYSMCVLVTQDNKNDVLSQKSRAPEPAMFGLPGTGHSKPAILSPGLSLLLLVHRPIPSCFNSCLNTNNSVFLWLLFDVCVNQCHSILLLPWLMSWLTSGRYLMTNWNCYRNQSGGKHHDTKGMATYSEFLPVVFSCYWNKCEMSAQRVLSSICCSNVSPKASVFIYPGIWRMITNCKVVCLLMDVIVMPWWYWHVGRGQG